MKKECVKCGKCKSVCPTYRITKTEDKSPRGRCHIASLVNSGFYHEGFIESLGSCLHCLACEEVCPRGVDITDEIINARAKLFLSGKYKTNTEQNFIDVYIGYRKSLLDLLIHSQYDYEKDISLVKVLDLEKN